MRMTRQSPRPQGEDDDKVGLSLFRANGDLAKGLVPALPPTCRAGLPTFGGCGCNDKRTDSIDPEEILGQQNNDSVDENVAATDAECFFRAFHR